MASALQPATNPLADLLGESHDTIGDAFGPELAALALEVPMNLALSRLGGELANIGIGVGTLIWGAIGTKNERMKHDLFELSAHFLNRSIATAARPSDLAEMLNDFQGLRGAAAVGNTHGIRAALVRTPDEIAGQVRSVSMMAANAFAQPPPPQNQQQHARADTTPIVVAQNGNLTKQRQPANLVLV